MASAVLVVILSIAVFTGLDGASATSGGNKKRSIAADLAQQDLERLRGTKPSTLSNLRETRNVTVSGVTYTVASRADWVTDRAGTVSCTGDARADYLQVTSTVTWPNMIRVRPVTTRTIIAPPSGSFSDTQGSLAVQVNDRNGNGVPNLPVNISGPATMTDTTNELGCAFFGYITAGSGYHVTFSRAGWVDRAGNNAVDVTSSVTAEAVTTLSVDYDRAASITAYADTKLPDVAAPQYDWLRYVTLENSGLPTGTKLLGDGGLQASLSVTNLFPFNEGYKIYPGNCPGARPPDNPPGWPAPIGLSPGEHRDVVLRQPQINVAVIKNSALYDNANVKLTPKSTGCSGVLSFKTAFGGRLFYVPGSPDTFTWGSVPYGTYDVCADDGVRKNTLLNRTNTTYDGTAAWGVINVTAGAAGVTTGTC